MNCDEYIILTGAFGALGKEICQRLIKKYNLILIDKVIDTEFLEKLHTSSTGKIKSVEIDFLNINEMSRLSNFLSLENLRISGLICVAGVMKKGTLEETSLEDWNNTLMVNLTSNFIICKLIIPLFKSQNYGNIVFISSVLGKVAVYDLLSYSVSKAALIHFSKNLALELQEFNIIVNCICPGFIKSNLYKDLLNNKNLNKNWFHLFGGIKNKTIEIEDVSKTVEFLLGQKSITGEEIIVDGGYSIR